MLSPLHPALRFLRRPRRKGTIPLNYRVVLAAVWVIFVGSFFVFQILPAESPEPDRETTAVTVIEEITPSPTLVSETSLVLEDPELRHHE